MTRTIILSLLCAMSVGAVGAEELTVNAVSTDVLLKDRVLADQRRPARFPSGEAGTVMIEHPDMSPTGWSDVRWLVRFPTSELTGQIHNATLVLWANSRTGDTEAPLLVRVLSGGQGETLQESELGVPLVEQPLEIFFPRKPGSIKVDVTEMLQKAQSEGLAYVAFEISAASEEMLEGRSPGRFFFGGIENNYQWSEWEAPKLEVDQ